MKWFLLILCICSSYGFAEDLKLNGRLFFSPKERVEIDRLRIQFEQSKLLPNQENSIPTPTSLKLKGFIKNSEGKNIIWLDNNNALEELNIPGLRVDISNINSDGLPIQIINGDKQIKIKPGQSLDTTNGQIMDIYNEQNSQNTQTNQTSKTP